MPTITSFILAERAVPLYRAAGKRPCVAAAALLALAVGFVGCAAPVVPPAAVPVPMITTVAGTGVAGIAGSNGPATSAEVSQVICVNFDAAGNLYITDNFPSVVHEIAAGSGTIKIIAGNTQDGFYGNGGPAANAYFYALTGCVTDSAGNLYVDDEANNQVRKINAATGIISGFIGNAVLDETASGTFSGDGGPAASAGINHPYGLALDKAGNFYISDTLNNRIRRVDAVTGLISTVGGNGISGYAGDGGAATAAEFSVPEGLIVDAAGDIIVADYGNSVVRKIAAGTGIITTIAGVYAPGDSQGYSGDGGPATAAKLALPTAVAMDAAGDLYIADAGNNRVRKISAATGIITTVVGTGKPTYTGDGGPAAEAGLHNPEGLTLSNDGTALYIADYFNYAVRKVSPLP